MYQLAKKQKKMHGELPAKKAKEVIWNSVNFDIWGPTIVNNKKDWQTENTPNDNDGSSQWLV